MSGYADIGEGPAAADAPMVVRKPLERDSLLLAFDKLLGRRPLSGVFLLKPHE